jgi:glycosyltransferase involved in cell wall biosynthesis
MTQPRSIAISWYFAHHAGHNGYKQILAHTRPAAVLGIDERQPHMIGKWHRSYPWLYEFRAWRMHRKNPCEILHILYAETYLRFSPWLFGSTPVVATYHQPPTVLRKNLLRGSQTGRVSNLVHRLTRKRYQKLAAAIIISEDQRPVLEEFVDPGKIHLIPLGAPAGHLIGEEARLRRLRDPDHILTVGNWLRDWEFYFDFVSRCQSAQPTWRFTLISRNLPARWHACALAAPNLSWQRDASDEALLTAYAGANCLFLPLLEATGNNTVNEALAMGCPIVTNLPLGIPGEATLVTRCGKSPGDFTAAIERWRHASDSDHETYRQTAQDAVRQLDWSVTAASTLELYQSVIQS